MLFPGMYSHRPLVVYGGPSKHVSGATFNSGFRFLPISDNGTYSIYPFPKGIGKNMVSGQTVGIYTGRGQSVQMEVLADLYRMWAGCM